MIPWYVESFGADYLQLYSHRNLAEACADVHNVVKLIPVSRTEPVLDLACGSGRHLQALVDEGFVNLVGLDLSAELLNVAYWTLPQLGECDCCSIDLVRADMRHIPFLNCFAAVLSLFTSFGYFESESDNLAVLESVHRSLKPGGVLLLDYMNRTHVLKGLVPCDTRSVGEMTVVSCRSLTSDGQRVEKTMQVTASSGETRQYRESVRLYTRDEMRTLLRLAGFTEGLEYGALDGRPFEISSPRLVLVAKKGEQ